MAAAEKKNTYTAAEVAELQTTIRQQQAESNRQTRYNRRATADAVAQVKQHYTFVLHSAGAWAGINFSAQVSLAVCANSGARSRTHCK